MRKQTKLVAVLSAAALLAIGASMTSFAATPHWDQEDGEWVYLDRNGERVSDTWKKSNGQWYYLDEDGYMARDRRVEYSDDLYYVDENGVKVTNAWVSMDNDDYLDDDDVSTVWYFFDGKGKAEGFNTTGNGVIKKLAYGNEGKTDYFIFNNEGVMLSGWQKWSKSGDNEKIYWLGDENEGWARTGWNYLNVEDEEIFEVEDDGDPYESEQWFWFDSQGRAKTNGTEVIGGKTYIFDANGFMQDLWVYDKVATATPSWTNDKGSSSAASAAFYVEDNGGRDKNWVLAYPKTDYEDYDDDQYWFWLNSKGKPFMAVSNDMTGNRSIGKATRLDDTVLDTDVNHDGDAAAKSIKNKTYLFNSEGIMLTGLYRLDGVRKGTSVDPMYGGRYYFTIDDSHSSVEGQMVTNKKVTIDVNGEDETYYFGKDGRAYRNVIISGSVFDRHGELVNDFGDGGTYDVVPLWRIVGDSSDGLYKKDHKNSDKPLVPVMKDGKYVEVLINGNGKIKQNGTVTDVNGNKVTVSNYIVQPSAE